MKNKYIKLYSVVLSVLFALTSCKQFTPEIIEIIDTFFDVGCIIANAEIPDVIRDRICHVPKKYQTKTHEYAAMMRTEKRAYAAKQQHQEDNIDGGAMP